MQRKLNRKTVLIMSLIVVDVSRVLVLVLDWPSYEFLV